MVILVTWSVLKLIGSTQLTQTCKTNLDLPSFLKPVKLDQNHTQFKKRQFLPCLLLTKFYFINIVERSFFFLTLTSILEEQVDDKKEEREEKPFLLKILGKSCFCDGHKLTIQWEIEQLAKQVVDMVELNTSIFYRSMILFCRSPLDHFSYKNHIIEMWSVGFI